jgi:hypothetical protein
MAERTCDRGIVRKELETGSQNHVFGEELVGVVPEGESSVWTTTDGLGEGADVAELYTVDQLV